MGKVSLLRDQFFFSPTCEISKGDCEVVCLLRPNKAAFYLGENIIAVGIGHMAIHDAIKWCKRSWKIMEIIVLR